MHIEIIRADITSISGDAIVNAANSHLQHGGGVAGAIVAQGGDSIQRESDAIGFVPVGGAVVTSSGNLLCKYVIHAVGPRMGEGNEETKLRSATLSALERAEEIGVRSVAFPAISTGIFGFPVDRCAAVMLQAVLDFEPRAQSVQHVVFCLFGKKPYDIFLETFRDLKNED
jgi:O-acetyl-ADP-ribose deacetylase